MKKVFIGMSGGVDSAVSALLLLEKGYEVEGVTLLLKPDATEKSDEVSDAKAVADKLGIKLNILDRREEFLKAVIEPFANEYYHARTPNPCIFCNPAIKFGSMLDYALEKGADGIATGHYAIIEQDNVSGQFMLKKAPSGKDQSYFLSRLSQNQISKAVFPIGNMSKDEVRLKAEKEGLIVAKKSDSQEICFVQNNDYASFIKNNFDYPFESGKFVDLSGREIGKHNGIIHYTVGQRKGLGGGFPETMYVKSINGRDNTITLCNAENRFEKTIKASKMNWISGRSERTEFEAEVKVRSTARPEEATVTLLDQETVKIDFKKGVACVSPGQTAAVYIGDVLLGGGYICDNSFN